MGDWTFRDEIQLSVDIDSSVMPQQGAQVTADFLCGRSSAGFPPTPPYSAVVTENSKSITTEDLLSYESTGS